MKRISLLIACLTFTCLSYAGVKDIKPQTACNFLKYDNIPTRPYKERYDGTHGCSSDYIEFDGNNIAYYVEASKNHITEELKIVVNVNNLKGAMQANMFTFFYANKLLEKFDHKAPEELAAAIMQGEAYSKDFKGVKLNFVREIWPSGNGFEMKVTVK